MDEKDRAAFLEYTGTNYIYANAVARGRREHLGERQKVIGDRLKAALDRAWETVPLTKEPMTLYRGIHTVQSQLDIDPKNPEASVGKSFVDKGWTSTTAESGKALLYARGNLRGKPDYSTGALLHISVPAGVPVLDVGKVVGVGSYGQEREHVLPRGGKFTITGARAGGTKTRLAVVEAKWEPLSESDLQLKDANFDDQRNALQAAGVLFVTKSGIGLFLRRVDNGLWSIPAGGVEDEDTDPAVCAQREAAEEVGYPGDFALQEIDHRTTNGVEFWTYVQWVIQPFDPILNDEHDDYVWQDIDDPPQPLHPGLKATLDTLKTLDTQDAGWEEEPRGEHGRWTAGGTGKSKTGQTHIHTVLSRKDHQVLEDYKTDAADVSPAALDSAIAKSRLMKDLTVWRGLGGTTKSFDPTGLNKLLQKPEQLVGRVFSNQRRPVSTTTSRKRAEEFARPWLKPQKGKQYIQPGFLVKMKVKAGARAIETEPFRGDEPSHETAGEKEILLHSQGQMHVLGWDSKTRTFTAEWVDPRAKKKRDSKSHMQDAGWEEEKHPRGEHGRFGAGGDDRPGVKWSGYPDDVEFKYEPTQSVALLKPDGRDKTGRLQVLITGVATPETERGRGGAHAVMAKVEAFLDKHGLVARLNAANIDTDINLHKLYSKHGFVSSATNRFEMIRQPRQTHLDASKYTQDPTGTSGLRRAFRAAAAMRLRKIQALLRTAIVEHDMLGLHTPQMAFAAPGTRLSSFNSWFASMAEWELTGPWWSEYFNRATAAGESKARKELKSDEPPPVHHSYDHLREWATTELKGIAAALAQQVSRVAAQLVGKRDGVKTAQAFRLLAVPFRKITDQRLYPFAHDMIVRVHLKAKLGVYRSYGVTHVGIEPELRRVRRRIVKPKDSLFRDQDEDDDDDDDIGKDEKGQTIYAEVITAEDDLVCQECIDIADGGPYEVDEAEDLIPAHPNCRCDVRPFVWTFDAAGVAVYDSAMQDAGEFDPSKHPHGEHGHFVETGGESGVSVAKFKADIAAHPHAAGWKEYDQLHEQMVAQTGDVGKLHPYSAAISTWTNPSGYKMLNEYLRGNNSSPQAAKLVPELDAAIKASPLANATVAWRGIHGPQAAQFAKLKPGDDFYNKGYTAVTLDPRRATHYGVKEQPGTILVYHLPEGSPALYTSHPNLNHWTAERELLLPHGAQFRIMSTEQIKAPVWNYSGELTSSVPHTFNVSHIQVLPEGEQGLLSLQVDLPPGKEQMPVSAPPAPAPAPEPEELETKEPKFKASANKDQHIMRVNKILQNPPPQQTGFVAYRAEIRGLIKEASSFGLHTEGSFLKAKIGASFARQAVLYKNKGNEQKAEQLTAKAKQFGWTPTVAPPPPPPLPSVTTPAPAPAALVTSPLVATAKATVQELETAKKTTPLPKTYEPEADKLITAFNEKYAGKTLTTQEELEEKVVAYKELKAKTAAAQEAKQQAAKEEAAKAAEALIGGTPEAKANYEVLKNIVPDSMEYIKAAKIKLTKGGLDKYLTPTEGALIMAYTGPYYKELNKQMWHGSMTEQLFAYAQSLSNALSKLPPYAGHELWRKVSLTDKEAERYKPGFIVTERAFTSSSKNQSTWHGSYRYRILDSKSGRDIVGLSSHPGESEVLFDFNRNFKVVSREGHEITLKEI